MSLSDQLGIRSRTPGEFVATRVEKIEKFTRRLIEAPYTSPLHKSLTGALVYLHHVRFQQAPTTDNACDLARFLVYRASSYPRKDEDPRQIGEKIAAIASTPNIDSLQVWEVAASTSFFASPLGFITHAKYRAALNERLKSLPATPQPHTEALDLAWRLATLTVRLFQHPLYKSSRSIAALITAIRSITIKKDPSGTRHLSQTERLECWEYAMGAALQGSREKAALQKEYERLQKPPSQSRFISPTAPVLGSQREPIGGFPLAHLFVTGFSIPSPSLKPPTKRRKVSTYQRELEIGC